MPDFGVQPEFDAAASDRRGREALAELDKTFEGKPVCRLCGQRTNTLDAWGLCPKISDPHKEARR